MPLPLDGVRVLELGQIYNGPYAGLLCALAGATVVKLEPPHGELLRARGTVGGAGHPFAMLNACKRSMTVDLKNPTGLDVLHRLVDRVDVVLDNFAPGALERMAIDRGELVAEHPRLIWATSNGFGSDSRYRDYLAMDLTVQAMSGAMSVTGFADQPPVKAGPAICDFLGGTHVYAGIVTALFQRERTGKGQVIEVSMMDTVLPTMLSSLGLIMGGRSDVPRRTGNRHNGLADSPYNTYQCVDGWIAIICVTDVQWRRLSVEMDRAELAEAERFDTLPKRAAAGDEIDQIVSEWSRSQQVDDLVARLRTARVPCAPVRDLGDVIRDEDLFERGMLQRVNHPILGEVTLTHSPIIYRGQDRRPLEASPELGEHTDEVLAEWLSLDAREIAQLHASRAV